MQPAEMSDISTKEYMENWLLQKNYPVVYIDLDNKKNSDKSVLTLTQDRYLLSQLDEETDYEESPFGY